MTPRSKQTLTLALLVPVAAAGFFGGILALREFHAPTPGRPLTATRHPGDPNHWIVSRLEKDSYLRDTAEVTRQITLKPTPGPSPDSVADLRIVKVDERSPMYAAGFRPEDRILKVNGTTVHTMGRAINLIQEIRACSLLTVQVERGGRILDYQFSFE
jgi:membrane-associated protease RseP (regulator of RpoE activity)